MNTLFPDEAKSIVEGLLFVSNEPLTPKVVAEILERNIPGAFVYLK